MPFDYGICLLRYEKSDCINEGRPSLQLLTQMNQCKHHIDLLPESDHQHHDLHWQQDMLCRRWSMKLNQDRC